MANLVELYMSQRNPRQQIYSICSSLMNEFGRTHVGYENHGFKLVDVTYEIDAENGLGVDYAIERCDGDYINEDLEEDADDPELKAFKREVELEIKTAILNTYLAVRSWIKLMNNNLN